MFVRVTVEARSKIIKINYQYYMKSFFLFDDFYDNHHKSLILFVEQTNDCPLLPMVMYGRHFFNLARAILFFTFDPIKSRIL